MEEWSCPVGNSAGEEGEPEGVDEGVDDGGGSEGAGFHPGAAVKEAGDGGEEDVAPVGDGGVQMWAKPKITEATSHPA